MNGVQLREKGNALYKRGQLTEAIKAYQEATRRAEPDDHLPWSNLSAAYYEAGNYNESIQSALRALTICQQCPATATATASAEQKLIPRMIRGYLHTHQFEAARQWLDRLDRAQSPPSTDDLHQYRDVLNHAETLWRVIPDERVYGSKLLARLPRYRPSLSRDQQSLNNIDLDEVTHLVDFAVHSNLQRNISVFLGGIGDARHFYAQIAILGVTERMVIQPATPLKRRYQFTLSDGSSSICPAIGRNLVLLVLLDELACSMDISQSERTEIYTTVYYIFAGVIIPRHALERALQTVDILVSRLRNGESALPWLQIYDTDRENLIHALESWKNSHTEPGLSTSEVIGRLVQGLYDVGMSYKTVYGLQDHPRAPTGCRKEFETYFKTPFLHAPRSVMREHEPELLRLVETDAPTEDLFKYLTENWCVNPALFHSEDDVDDAVFSGNPFDVCRALYNTVSIQEKGGPRKTKLFDYASSFFQQVVVSLRKIRGRLSVEYLLGDTAEIIDGIQHGLIEGRKSAAPTAFDLVHLSGFVGNGWISPIVNVSKLLNDSQTARLMISTLSTDLDLREEYDGDYVAANSSDTLFKATQMRIVGKKSQYESSSSPSTSDGCLLELRKDRLAPFQYEQLLSRAELTRFVFTQFFRLAVPSARVLSSSASGYKHSHPTAAGSPNLTYFFDLLIHLHEMGYVAHWLADILTKILGDGMNVSSLSPPRTPDESNPRSRNTTPSTPTTATSAMMRSVHGTTAPFIPEMSTLTTMFQRFLPFHAITSLPSPTTIYQYSINLKSISSEKESATNAPLVLILHNVHVPIPTSSTMMTLLPLPEEGCIVITTFTVAPDSTDDNDSGDSDILIKFWMREDVMTQIQGENTWSCALLCASDNSDDEWTSCNVQCGIGSAIKGDQWVTISPDEYDERMEVDDD